ncbi:hypothetical protein [Pseudomonas sp. ACM7]|uniref:hypothetical protein n=1 Tax=Pseudomonas sp. ACM7 TaxID=2052956 RepID=UPI0010131184|nr:hypothetical protein [Pseudomonas sp. ACM7]QAY92221.1 hypothetical protein CUN63_20885 [Pseudomonas sp. ACM7]
MEFKFYCTAGGIYPVVGQVFHRRAEVSSGKDTRRYDRYVCGVLNAIAQTQQGCGELLHCITSIENGSETSVIGGGNDVELTMDASGVQVDILINDDWVGQPEGKFTLQEWRVVLEQWRHFLGLPESLETVVTVKLP